jgi:hypothetical protein
METMDDKTKEYSIKENVLYEYKRGLSLLDPTVVVDELREKLSASEYNQKSSKEAYEGQIEA